MSAWIRRGEINDPNRLKGWLATAVVNESLAVLRREKTGRRVLRLMGSAEPVTDHMKRSSLDEQTEAVMLALADLDVADRMTITLRVMNGLSGREVAAMLGVSDSQVSKLLHRGMEKLRSKLAQLNQR